MIKKIAFVVAFAFISQLTIAQNLSFGPIVGANFSELYNLSNSSTKTGAKFGAFINYSTEKSFGVGLQVYYNQLGANTANSTDKLKLNYIEVPLLATYYLGHGISQGSFRPKVFIGPHVDFLLNAADSRGNDVNPNGSTINSVDYGVTVGAGLNYALAKKTWLNFDIRYAAGLSDVYKSPALSTVRNNNISINVGVSFPIGNL